MQVKFGAHLNIGPLKSAFEPWTAENNRVQSAVNVALNDGLLAHALSTTPDNIRISVFRDQYGQVAGAVTQPRPEQRWWQRTVMETKTLFQYPAKLFSDENQSIDAQNRARRELLLSVAHALPLKLDIQRKRMDFTVPFSSAT